MALPIRVPRINNNDDEVKLVELKAAIGDRVRQGQVVALVETDKAVVEVEAPADGYLLATFGEPGGNIAVGSVLAWLGGTADEPLPDEERATSASALAGTATAAPTAKAKAMLREFGLKAEDVPMQGERLGADDVERHVIALGLRRRTSTASESVEAAPEVAGTLRPLRNDQRGMLATVTWHRDVAVPGYLELSFDQGAWDQYASAFQERHGLLLNPMLPLMAWQLVRLAVEAPALNATIVGSQRHEYTAVNLGFTVQAADILYLTVTAGADALDELAFVTHLIDLQRRAAAHTLGTAQTRGATIGFSSMARWKVNRHIPVLAPHTALMVAHTVTAEGQGILGATYDHRVLHGADVVMALRKLARVPPRR